MDGHEEEKEGETNKGKVTLPPKIYDTNRPMLNAKDLKERYTFNKVATNNALKGTLHYMKKRYHPTPMCMLNFIYNRIPFVRWIQTYDVKNNLAKDIIAGLTIGIIHIPQGIY